MKKKGISWPSFLFGAVTAFICIGFLFLLGFVVLSLRAPDRPDSLASALKIREMETIIRQKCLNEFDEKKQTDMMCLGLTAGLDDSYAAYYTKEEYESVRLSNKGYMQGIGVTIRQEDGDLVIQTVIEDSPAFEAGLLAGDVLLKIDGTDLTGLTSADAAALIQGSEDQTVTVLVRRKKTAGTAGDTSGEAETGAVSDTSGEAEPSAAPDSSEETEPGAASDTSGEEEPGAASDTSGEEEPGTAQDSSGEVRTGAVSDSSAETETGGAGENEETEEIEIKITKGELEITSVNGGTLDELLDEGQQEALLSAIAGASSGETVGRSGADTGDISLGEIGYINISRFNGTTSDQFSILYAKLQEAGIKALIIDLRDNLGGIVEGCCDTLRQILPEGVIVYESDRTGPERARECEGETPITIPLVLLVNGSTASASEIFAGAVQDYGIGKIVGTQTYGKGVEQNSYRLSDGSVLKLTTTHYYTPEHNDINEVGITPDYQAEQDPDAETDMQLAAALRALN